MENTNHNRRGFLKTGTIASAGLAASASIARSVHASGSSEIRFVVIGCGGRGTGAAKDIFNSGGNVKLVAVHDAFAGNAVSAVRSLKRESPDKVDVPEDRIFSDLDGFKAAIDVDCDLVVIATPPAFKPQQYEYAVKKGRHVFMEKPVASDVAGVRRVLAATEESKKKNLLVGIGLQRRHEPQYIETIKRLHDGAIGDIIAMRVYWNGGGIWYRDRNVAQGLMPGGAPVTEMAFQCNNWYHFNWLSGDQICEQHIHNLDVGCWVKGKYPVECNGMGGREMREGGDRKRSQIFDHTFCEYTFDDGTKMFSQGRHLQGGWESVAEFAHGSLGNSKIDGRIDGKNPWQFSGKRLNGHQHEQVDLIAALSKGEIYNEGEYGAKSTFTAILGREACYSGKVIKWDDLMNSEQDLCPGIDSYTLKSEPPVKPDENGNYPIPVPGQYSPFKKTT
jgi:myo-inositol 2-dehydrogenase / D-chiro-inositol 1-dehydrogenase